jgi:hypothetical protein
MPTNSAARGPCSQQPHLTSQHGSRPQPQSSMMRPPPGPVVGRGGRARVSSRRTTPCPVSERDPVRCPPGASCPRPGALRSWTPLASNHHGLHVDERRPVHSVDSSFFRSRARIADAGPADVLGGRLRHALERVRSPGRRRSDGGYGASAPPPPFQTPHSTIASRQSRRDEVSHGFPECKDRHRIRRCKRTSSSTAPTPAITYQIRGLRGCSSRYGYCPGVSTRVHASVATIARFRPGWSN